MGACTRAHACLRTHVDSHVHLPTSLRACMQAHKHARAQPQMVDGYVSLQQARECSISRAASQLHLPTNLQVTETKV